MQPWSGSKYAAWKGTLDFHPNQLHRLHTFISPSTEHRQNDWTWAFGTRWLQRCCWPAQSSTAVQLLDTTEFWGGVKAKYRTPRLRENMWNIANSSQLAVGFHLTLVSVLMCFDHLILPREPWILKTLVPKAEFEWPHCLPPSAG